MNPQKHHYKPKSDRYDKVNQNKLLLMESSWASSSFDTVATANPEDATELRECRICLSPEDTTGSKQLHSPCKCTGSVKYLHSSCFLQWMNKNFEQKKSQEKVKILKQGTECQICKYKIPIKGIFESQWGSFDQISFKIKRKLLIFSIFTFMLMICLGVLSFVIVMMLKLGVSFDGNSLVDSLIMICSLAVVVILASIVGYFYVSDYFIYEKFVISDFGKPAQGLNPEVLSQINIKAQIEPSIINLED